jgi:hypothetical protein
MDRCKCGLKEIAYNQFNRLNLGLSIMDRVKLHQFPSDPKFVPIVKDPDPEDNEDDDDH